MPKREMFDVLLTEREAGRSLRRALERGRLPESAFYATPASVRAWLALCGDGPYKNYARSMALVRAHGPRVARALPAGPVEVVSLGSGQGDKDGVLLDALRAAGRAPFYRPVDSSRRLLRRALRNAAGTPRRGLQADMLERRLSAALPAGPPRLLLLLGNTLGFDPAGLAKACARLLRSGDRLLVDAETPGTATVAGYDNPVNRRFALAPLRLAGLKPADGRLSFRLSRAGKGLHRLDKWFETPERRIGLSVSYKFTQAGLSRVLAGAGLRIARVFRGEHFLLALAALETRRAGAAGTRRRRPRAGGGPARPG